MGFRLYKSVGLGKGVRLNLSKTGVGVSAGVPGLRYSVHSSGRHVKTAGIPGTGVYYRKDSYPKKRQGAGLNASHGRTGSVGAPAIYPKAGLLAPKREKLFAKGVTEYMEGRHEAALSLFQGVSAREGSQEHVAEEFFAGMCLVSLQRNEEAITPLEHVLASDHEIPDPLMTTYNVGGLLEIKVTPNVTAQLPMSSLATALMLAEVYQDTARGGQAIELLESLGSLHSDVAFALSLADLYSEAERWEDIVRVTEQFPSNEDDATAQLLLYRAQALYELNVLEGALTVTKETLRFKKRPWAVLLGARYLRGLTYEKAEKKSQARKEFERVFAKDAGFADVAKRLGIGSTEPVPQRPDQP